MQGVIIYAPAPKTRTACATALNNIPDTLGLSPSLPIISIRKAHIFPALHTFPTTASQLSSEAVKIHPKYLKRTLSQVDFPRPGIPSLRSPSYPLPLANVFSNLPPRHTGWWWCAIHLRPSTEKIYNTGGTRGWEGFSPTLLPKCPGHVFEENALLFMS